jgi:hypothetical protein
MLHFDEHGFLNPTEPILSDWETVQKTFVYNPRRERLFEAYINFLIEVKREIPKPFFQWVNGSFVTKKLYPNDIDLVTFLDFEVYESKEAVLNDLRYQFRPAVDAYFAAVYPENHDLFVRFKTDTIQWRHDFSSDKKKKQHKGFIQLNF